MPRGLGVAIQRIMVRTDRGPLRAIWSIGYRAAVKLVAELLTAGIADSTVYLRGSLGWNEVRHGLSDIDMAVVVPARHRNHVQRRWRRLTRILPGLNALFDMAVYEPRELEAVCAASTITASEPVHLPPDVPPDQAGLRLRPGLDDGPLRLWKPYRGKDVRPQPTPQPLQVNAWLELQAVWRDAFRVCIRPDAVTAPHTWLKLVADPARILLALTTDARPTTRTAVLKTAGEPAPTNLREALGTCLRLSNAIAQHLDGGEATSVELIGADTELALQPDAAGRPGLLPLADWRARCWPLHPDDAFVPSDRDPADPAQLAEEVRSAGGYGPYPALRHRELMIIAGPGLLRAVQCRTSDPVTFALAEGATAAEFSSLPGLSAHDCARRAVLEHAAWLGAAGPPRLSQWIRAQHRTSAPANYVLGWLFSAIRAGLFLESLRAGRPELHVTMSSAADQLHLSEAFAEYRASRLDRTEPRANTVLEVREATLALPVYAYEKQRVAVGS